MVSCVVETAAPADVGPWPVLASALVAALRAELLLAVAAAVAVAAPVGASRSGFGGRRRDRTRRRVGDGGAGGRSAGGRHVDVVQRIRILGIAGVDFHHDVILVDRAVDHRYLALSESVVQRVVDLQRADAEPRGRIAVDVKKGFQPALLLVRTDVGQDRIALQRVDELWRPGVQQVHVFGLQRVLILRVALPASCAKILNRGHVKAPAGNLVQFWTQPRDHLIDGGVTLRQRLERNEHVAGIDLRIAAAAAADAGIADHVLHRRILLHDGHHLPQLLTHEPGTRCFDRPEASRRCARCPAAGKKPLGTKMNSSTFRQIVPMKIISTSPLC